MMKTSRQFLAGTACLILALAVTQTQAARLYKWVDEDGNVSYHDRPPPQDTSYHVEEKHFRGHGGVDASEADREVARQHPVVLYRVPSCAACDNARTHLQQRQVPFQEQNIEGNRELLEKLRQVSGAISVPTITVGEKVMQGYNQAWLDSELDRVGYSRPSKESTPAEEAQ